MIARIWRGVVNADRAEEYLQYIRDTGVADYRATPGFRDVQMLTRTRDGRTLITVVSLWDSLDSVKAFAGEEYEAAHYYPEDEEFLVERFDTVEHHEVVDPG